MKLKFFCCSDFRYKSNGIIVLGVGFFLQTDFNFLTSHFKSLLGDAGAHFDTLMSVIDWVFLA